MRAALYARYSTENQREASIDDQLRECKKLAAANDFVVVDQFADYGISGGTSERPGYQLMLSQARVGKFEAIVAEDLSRLWRGMAEQAPRLAELSDLGLHVVTHDFDSRQDSAEILGAVSGAMNSIYRKEISRRTKRGLEGKALAGQSTGGRCYGYRGITVVDVDQAHTIRKIFELCAEGWSAQHIANIIGCPQCLSPGGKTRWAASTILSILRNPRYTGAVRWGKTASKPSAVDSRLRRRLVKPQATVERQDESLRIVPQELWDRVQRTISERRAA
jgi:DNA invertase Pin-like site-specific DNA recombinase